MTPTTDRKTEVLDYAVFPSITNFGYQPELEEQYFVVTSDQEMESLSKQIGKKIIQGSFDFSKKYHCRL